MNILLCSEVDGECSPLFVDVLRLTVTLFSFVCGGFEVDDDTFIEFVAFTFSTRFRSIT